MVTIEKILLEFDPMPENLLPALKGISAAFGYVSEIDAEKTADYFRMPLAKVYETASFYDQIKVAKQPGLVIQVCSSTNCVLNESFKIIKMIENYFHIKAGDQFNSKIKLEAISCLNQCGDGPIVEVNGKVYTNVSTSNVYKILEEWTQ